MKLALAAWMALVGCQADADGRMIVDLETDYVPGLEMASVRLEVAEAGSEPLVVTEPAMDRQDYVRGVRVAELALPGRGDYVLDTTLIGLDGAPLAARRIHVRVRSATTSVTVVIARTCEGLSCPPGAVCHGDRCVDPECSPERPEPCGDAACVADSGCPPAVDCSTGRCVDGVCLQQETPGVCAPDEWCSVAAGGCVPRPGAEGCARLEDCGPDEVCIDGACSASRCGDGVLDVRRDEECDDGGTEPGDGCDEACRVPAAAFRATSLSILDPHLFARAPPGLCMCVDLTSFLNSGFAGGISDRTLNLVTVFERFDPTAEDNPVELWPDATCDAATGCRPDDFAPTRAVARWTMAGDAPCYAADPATLNPGYPSPPAPMPPCFATDPSPFALFVDGQEIPLLEARVAARLEGDRFVDGVLVGYMTAASVMGEPLTHDALCSPITLWDGLPGGGSCSSGDDRDAGPGGVADGWWLYAAVEAAPVAWTAAP